MNQVYDPVQIEQLTFAIRTMQAAVTNAELNLGVSKGYRDKGATGFVKDCYDLVDIRLSDTVRVLKAKIAAAEVKLAALPKCPPLLQVVKKRRNGY